MDHSPPGSSVYEISQARILEWLLFPTPGDCPNPGIKPASPAWQADSLPLSHQGHPLILLFHLNSWFPRFLLASSPLYERLCWDILSEYIFWQQNYLCFNYMRLFFILPLFLKCIFWLDIKYWVNTICFWNCKNLVLLSSGSHVFSGQIYSLSNCCSSISSASFLSGYFQEYCLPFQQFCLQRIHVWISLGWKWKLKC